MHETLEVLACSEPANSLAAWLRVPLPNPCDGAVLRLLRVCDPNMDLPCRLRCAMGRPAPARAALQARQQGANPGDGEWNGVRNLDPFGDVIHQSKHHSRAGGMKKHNPPSK